MKKKTYTYKTKVNGNNCEFTVDHDLNKIDYSINGRYMDTWTLLFTITSQKQLEVYVEDIIQKWDAAIA